MYRQEGEPLHEREEGAAFYPAIGREESRVLGLQPGMLTHGFVKYDGVGADEPAVEPDADAVIAGMYEHPFWRFLSIAGAALGAYHGYKRNDSIGWAIGWAFLGSIVPIVTIPIAFAQGFAQKKR